jgi:CRP/FNR family cyclic AMP-dependent transcriptional regulator
MAPEPPSPSTSFLGLAPTTSFRVGELIGVQGEPCDGLRIIARGTVLLSSDDPKGNSHALYLLGPGDDFGEGALRPERRWLLSARAVTDGAVHVLRTEQLPRLIEQFPLITADVLSFLCGRLERAHRRLGVLMTRGPRDRLLGLLAELAHYHGDAQQGGIWIPMHLSAAELGEMVGLPPRGVSRVLRQLEAEGLVRREGTRGLWLTQTGTGKQG